MTNKSTHLYIKQEILLNVDSMCVWCGVVWCVVCGVCVCVCMCVRAHAHTMSFLLEPNSTFSISQMMKSYLVTHAQRKGIGVKGRSMKVHIVNTRDLLLKCQKYQFKIRNRPEGLDC
jgi:hypothetical protein